MMSATALTLVLLLQPPGTSEVEGDGASYDDASTQMEDAREAVGDSPSSELLEELERAIEVLQSFGEALIGEPEGYGIDSILTARLSLARGYKQLEPPDKARAEAILDQVLRTNDPALVDAKIQGLFPDLSGEAKKAKDKLAAEGKATIKVTCHQGCVVAVDNYPLGAVSTSGEAIEHEFYHGTHTVLILSTDGENANVVQVVELGEDGEQLSFGTPIIPEVEIVPVVELVGAELKVVEAKRKLPRWAEIVGVGVGSALIVTGGTLLSFDERCTDVSGHASEVNCPQMWESTAGGAVTLGVGIGLSVAAAVLLTIDERKAGRGNQRARLELQPNGVLRF